MPTAGIVILMFAGTYLSFHAPPGQEDADHPRSYRHLCPSCPDDPRVHPRGSISSLYGERRERLFPLAVTFVFYLLTFLLFLRIPFTVSSMPLCWAR